MNATVVFASLPLGIMKYLATNMTIGKVYVVGLYYNHINSGGSHMPYWAQEPYSPGITWCLSARLVDLVTLNSHRAQDVCADSYISHTQYTKWVM